MHSGFWLGGIVGDQVANNIYMYNIYNFGDITAIQNVKNTPYASTNIYIGGISSSNVNVLGAYNGGNIKAIITDTDLAVNNNCSVNIGGILGVSGDINNKIGSTYNCGNLESNAADITNIGGIFGKGINDSEYEYVATINDKQLHSYYNKTSTRINGIVVNGNNFGIVVDDVNDIYNGDMLGIYDVDSIGEGMSNTPKPIIPDPTPKPDPIPNPDPIPQPDPDPVKPVVPSVFDPNNKEYDGIISTVTQDYIDSLVDKNVEKIKNNSINDTPVKKVKVYEEVTPPKDYEITRKRIMDSLAEKLIEAKKAMDNEEVAAKQNAYEKLKSYITLSPSVNLDEKVYEAFLKPISEKIKASKINEYDSNISFNFVKEIGGALLNGLKKIPDQTVKVGNKVYSIHYDMDYTYQGLTSVIATVTWKEGKTTKSTRMVLTNVNKKDGAKALAEYSYGLAKLNKDVWVNAATELVSVGLKDIKGNSKALVATKKIEAFSEKLLNALSDDALAEAFAVDIGGATKDVVVNEGKNVLWNTASKRFEKLIEKQIPGGSDIIELAHGLQKLEKEFDTYNNSISTYQNDPNQVNKINAAYWGVSQMVNNMISGL